MTKSLGEKVLIDEILLEDLLKNLMNEYLNSKKIDKLSECTLINYLVRGDEVICIIYLIAKYSDGLELDLGVQIIRKNQDEFELD